MKQEHQIYQYADPREYLKYTLKEKKQRNPRFSLRSWAMQMGLDNHALLSMVLNGKRRLKPQLAKKIEKTLKFQDQNAREYFQLLVSLNNASFESEKELYIERLAQLHPKKEFSRLDIATFRVISDWYHITILEMVELKNFRHDPVWISKRLNDEIDPSEARKAIQRLIQVGLLEESPNGRLKKIDSQRFTENDIPRDAIKTFHTQMLEKAQAAITQQSTDEREITGYTMSIDRYHIPLAKKMIRKFQKQFARALATDNGDATYQFNMQFFSLTNNQDEDHTGELQ